MTSRRDLLLGAAASTFASMALPHRTEALPALSGAQSWILMRQDGRIVDGAEVDRPSIPASTIKIATTFAILGLMRPDGRFFTRLITDGDASGGVLRGNLYLVGGGDPTLNTADLSEFADALLRFLHYSGALPPVTILNPRQPWQATYNPAISGLNLNFNRALIRWRSEQGRATATAWSEADGVAVQAGSVRCRVDPNGERYAHENQADHETWIVPGRLLNRRGQRFLPVRDPSRFAAETLRGLAAQRGIMLPPAEMAQSAPLDKPPLHMHRSEVIYALTTQMMKYSTNLTAEALGLTAAQKLGGAPRNTAEAAGATAEWLRGMGAAFGHVGANGFAMENHSGLGTGSRISARQLAELTRTGAARYGGAFTRTLPVGNIGTMHFVRALAGTLDINGTPHVFAIMAADEQRRQAMDAAFTPYDDARPPGARQWNRVAVAHEKALLRRWIKGAAL